MRRGGFDRVLVAADWSPGIEELCERGVRGAVYAHELVRVRPGEGRALLKAARKLAVPAYGELGATLIGAFHTGMGDDSEGLLLWAFPDWASWGEFERQADEARALLRWRKRARELGARVQRFLMVDAPLSPLRTGRQPRESDRESRP
jgi:hypothetical protein